MPTSQDSRQGSPDSVSVLVPGSHPDLVLLTGIDDDELTHHPFVLVQEHMAVVHIRQVRVGVVLEAHEESVDAIQIGRASCRERGERSGGTGALKERRKE